MKCQALASGFDGSESYQAGEELSGNNDHIRRLLFNGAAVPKDKEAKDFVAEKDEMSDKAVRQHLLYNDAIVNMVRDLDTIEETLKVRKKQVKTAKKATKARK